MSRRTLPLFSLMVFLAVGLNFAQEGTTAPERPTDLRATTRYDGATAVAVLQWRDGSENELGFEILRSDNSQDYRVVGMVGANTLRYEDKIGRYITGAFVYKVRAFNQAGKSEESNTVSVWF
jgi:hypothetical protein